VLKVLASTKQLARHRMTDHSQGCPWLRATCLAHSLKIKQKNNLDHLSDLVQFLPNHAYWPNSGDKTNETNK